MQTVQTRWVKPFGGDPKRKASIAARIRDITVKLSAHATHTKTSTAAKPLTSATLHSTSKDIQ